ncbi:MAG TPA: PIG-L family deacetylase [Thermoanaerobaculia bacterium]|nr:PIG-L family deacetylase [Thermoanaerobaculia bacterium]
MLPRYNAPVIEAETIPYEPAQLRGERLLVLAPHPDDEAIGCGGLVALHLREKRVVRIVVATDGAQGGTAETREQESRRGVSRLGDKAEIEFLRFADRSFGNDAAPRLREELLSFRPDLILVPGPIEIHPDHLALSQLFCELVQSDETLFVDLAAARVAFYEVGQPLRPNAIVDITDVAETKYAAIAEHRSQLAQRDYVAYARGLNAYRAMTMPPSCRFAEGYFVLELPSLRTMPFSEVRRLTGTPARLETARETLPVSVVIRTKDRPALLREAIDSVRAAGYPCELVVVNDGGARVELEGVTLVEHETSRGRAEAGNAGVRAASNGFIAFLDDDDLFYPEHLETLARAARSQHAAWYTDAVSAFLRLGESGAYETRARLRVYAQDFDRDLLAVDNYIPLPALLLRRELFLDAGGFDASFDLFEDWDLLLRLAKRGDFLRVPRVTCEIRHFEGGSSVILAAPEGSEEFRAAKLRVWEKHGVAPAVFARAFEKQKRRLGEVYSHVVTARGETDLLRHDVDRLLREKEAVLAQNAQAQDTINGYAMRVRELEATAHSLQAIASDYHNKTVQVERLTREQAQLREAHAVTHQELERTRVEIARLNGLLEMIYRSKTWKLHTTLERFRGRG